MYRKKNRRFNNTKGTKLDTHNMKGYVDMTIKSVYSTCSAVVSRIIPARTLLIEGGDVNFICFCCNSYRTTSDRPSVIFPYGFDQQERPTP